MQVLPLQPILVAEPTAAALIVVAAIGSAAAAVTLAEVILRCKKKWQKF